MCEFHGLRCRREPQRSFRHTLKLGHDQPCIAGIDLLSIGEVSAEAAKERHSAALEIVISILVAGGRSNSAETKKYRR